MTTLEKIKPRMFNKPALAALGIKSGYTNNIVYAYDDDVYNAVLASLGITDDGFGMQGNQTRVRYCFTAALKNLERNDLALCVEGRGKWRLTQDGIELSRKLAHLLPRENKLAFDNVNVVEAEAQAKVESEPEAAAPVEAVVEAAPESLPPLEILPVEPEVEEPETEEEVSLGEGISFDFIESQITDSYIVNLMVDGANCFGSWSNRSSTCDSCPLQAQCQQRQLVMLAELAAEMERQAAAEREAALSQARQSQVFSGEIDVQVEAPAADPDINLFDGLFEPGNATPSTPYDPSASILAPVELWCEGCGSVIAQNEPCKIKAGIGAHHLGCV